MTRFAFRRIVTAFVLVAVLGVPLSSVAAPSAERLEDRDAATVPFFAKVWDFFARAWLKEGCPVELFGICLPSTQDFSDVGCSQDPFGRCITSTGS